MERPTHEQAMSERPVRDHCSVARSAVAANTVLVRRSDIGV